MTIRDILITLGFNIDEASQQEAEQGINSLKNMAAKALGAIGIGLSIVGISSAINDCVELSSEVEEMQNKFDVVFQGMTDEVEDWAQSYADAIGRNSNDIKTYLADQQNLLVGFGMTRQEGAELSKQMTTLALDLASFANLDEDSAVNNMTKAVMGESEAAKALGAVINDVTREQAMQTLGLSGTYDKLDQLTKMQVNYQAILAQSPDAIGDCERSLGSYRSTVISFQSKLKEIKTLIGQFFMPTFQKVISFGSKGLTVLGDGVQRISEFAESVGGAERILAVLGATVGATLAIVNFQKIVDGIKMVGKGLSSLNVKTAAIAAAVLLVVLLIQDFIAFMSGENSLIGALFDKAGIGADNAREAILNAWTTVKDFLLNAWDVISSTAQSVFGALSAWWEENGEQVKSALLAVWNAISTAARMIFGALSDWWQENGEKVLQLFSQVWGAIKTLCTVLWNALSTAARAVFGALQAFWDTWGSTIISVFSTIWNTLISLIQPFFDAMTAVVDFLSSVFAGNWSGAWNAIKDFAAAAWNGLIAILNGAWEIITTVWSGIVSFFSGIFQNVWSAITEKVSAIKETIVNGFQSAIDWIKSLPSQAIQWGADIIDGIVSGITGTVGRIGEAAKGVADKITSFLHFSRPDEGPLAEYESWMPDFVGGLAQGIRDSIPVVQKAVEELSGNMRVDAEAEAPRISGGVGVEQEGRLLDLVSRLAEAILNSISTVYRTIAEQFSNIQVSGAVQAPDLIGMDAGTQEREAPGAEHIGELAELIRSGVTAIRQIAVNVTAQEPTVSAENRDSISSEWHGQAAPQGGTVTRKPIDVADSGISQDGGWQERLLRLVEDGITQVRGVLVDAVSGITSYVMGGRPEPPENLKASNWQQPIKTGDDNQGRYQKPGNEKWTVLINSFGELSGIAGAVGTEITGAITALASSSGNILETIVRASTASPKTAAVAGNTTNVYNITQNVNISNEFNGDRAGQEKSSVAMDKATEDATSEMARALKFARG
ncbi:MAG: hypothetical protein HFF62_15855 [Oscillospiraceae bacterium]|nr:hypothetical protein [Oscillospiraceae bacterium]